tara:strand:- start:45 stop:827 length:783 start_codon:yes stop_codon:yes gene_type:complete
MTSTSQNNNNNLAIATLNKFSTECIKIIEDLKKELATQIKTTEHIVALGQKRMKLHNELVGECEALKKDNKSLTQENKQLKGQLPKPDKATKIIKNKNYFAAYDTKDFIVSKEKKFCFVDESLDLNGEIDYDHHKYFDLDPVVGVHNRTTFGSVSVEVGDRQFATTFKEKKYLYVNYDTQLAEKIFFSYTKKDLVAFAMDTMEDWKNMKVLTCDKLITKDDDYIPQTAALETFNPEQELESIEIEAFTLFPKHIKTATYY